MTVAVTAGAPARAPSVWRISEEPELQIGAIDGQGPDLFASIRGSLTLRGGEIAVVDGASRELRLFGPDGTFRHAAGRRGAGPGEFTSPRLVPSVDQDTVVVFDLAARRLTSFAARAELAGTAPFSPVLAPRTSPEPLGSVGRHVLVVHRNIIGVAGDEPGRFYVLDAMSGDADTLLVLPGRRTEGVMVMIPETGGEASAVMAAPFDLRPTGTVGPRSFFLTAAQGPEILEYDPETFRLVRIIRLDEPRERVTRAHLDQIKERQCRGAPDRRECLRWWNEEGPSLPPPEFMPAFDRLLADDLGWLWARVYDPFREVPGHHWLVFDPAGRGCGIVEVPAGIDPMHVTSDRILTTWRDDLGIEYVRIHRLVRGDEAC